MASIRVLPHSDSTIFLNKEVMDSQRRGKVVPIPVCLVLVPVKNQGIALQRRMEGSIVDWQNNQNGSWDATVKLESFADGMRSEIFLHLPARSRSDPFCWTCRNKPGGKGRITYRVQIL